jgi:hypothetical protein
MYSELGTCTITLYELINNNPPFDLGLDKYPIFDEAYRPILNNAIIQTYLTREICFSNPALWRQKLQNRMDIIMRNKYNALYKAKQMEFNPLYTMELYETYSHSVDNKGQNSATGQTNTTQNGTSQNTTTNKNNTDAANTTNDKTTSKNDNNSVTNNNSLGLTSQFPSEEMTENDLTSNLFVDNAQKNTGSESTNAQQTEDNSTTSNSVTNQSSNSEGTENNTTNQNGNVTNSNSGTIQNNLNETYSKKTIGSASDLTFAHAMTQFKDYCDQFNLDQLVVNELKDLFITVW